MILRMHSCNYCWWRRWWEDYFLEGHWSRLSPLGGSHRNNEVILLDTAELIPCWFVTHHNTIWHIVTLSMKFAKTLKSIASLLDGHVVPKCHWIQMWCSLHLTMLAYQASIILFCSLLYPASNRVLRLLSLVFSCKLSQAILILLFCSN